MNISICFAKVCSQIFTGRWRPQNDDTNPWIQIELNRTMTILGIQTLGYGSYYVKSYKIYYSDAGKLWTVFTDETSNDKVNYMFMTLQKRKHGNSASTKNVQRTLGGNVLGTFLWKIFSTISQCLC